MNWYCTSRTMKGLVVAGLTCSLTTAFAASGEVASKEPSKKVTNGVEMLKNWQPASEQMTRKYAGLLNNQPSDGVISRGGVPNDECDGAILIACGGGAVAGDNTGATDSNTTASCSFGGQPVNSDVWFKFVAADVDARVSLCGGGSLTDTVVRVFSGDCANLTEIACNDDFCGLLSEVCATGLTVGQTYYVAVAGWNTTAQGTFTIEVLCPCTPACAQCQPGDIAEGEPTCADFYVDATNGGCNSTPTVFGSLSIGQTVCGTSGNFLGTIPDPNDPNNPFVVQFRDTDWFEFNVPSRQLVTWSVTAEFPSLIFLLNAGCPTTALGNAAGATCGTASLTRCLEAGTYVAFVATQGFSGVACGAHYRGTLSATDCPPPPDNDECSGATLIVCGDAPQQFTNEFASTGANDIPASCAFGGAQTGANSVWFKFVATATGANVSLCPGVAGGLGDSLAVIYSGSCDSLTEIACNDDSCGLISSVTANGLTVGQTYYVRISTWVGGGALSGAFNLALSCFSPPTNDACTGAIPVTIGTPVQGTTLGTTTDTAPTCGTTISAPGVWYTVVGTGNILSASTCSGNTNYDTKLNVYCGSCPNTFFCVTGVDDDPNCPFDGFQSTVEWCSAAGQTYYILVQGFGGATGNFELTVSDTGLSCSNPVSCEPPPPVTNDACSDAINVAVPSSTLGTTIGATVDGLPTCGTTITQPGVWYRVVGNGQTITVTTCNDVTDYDTKISVFCGTCNSLTCVGGNDDGGTADCALPNGGANFESRVTFCSQNTAVYYVLVHGFSGVGRFQLDVSADGAPCNATVQCVATGSCCIGNECVVTTGADCASRNGHYNGDGSSCGGGSYQVSTISDPIIDISGTGIASTAGGCDDACSENVVLPFSFSLFGSSHGDVWINANGFLSFGAGSADFSNDPIPNAATPNDIICPMWDDFNGGVEGDVYYQSLSSPDRFVVMYKNMRRFGATSGQNTFEAILYADGSIEYRYGAIEGALLSATVGIENVDGTQGVSIAQADLGDGNTGRRITNAIVANPCVGGCPLPGCVENGVDADFDGDCDVDLTDLAFLLINFGTPTGMTNAQGDTDGDGDVDLTDLAQVLIRFGLVCH